MYGIIIYNVTKLSPASCPSQEEVQFFHWMHYILLLTSCWMQSLIDYNKYI